MTETPESTAAEHQLLRITRRGSITLLVLNRPEAHNALNDALLVALVAELRALRDDIGVRAVIVTGAGRSFCSGDDLKAAADATPAHFAETIRLLQAVTVALFDIDKPVIAALNGAAFGAGLELALNCDLRIATDDFICATPETRLGLTLTNGASVLLPLLIGSARARRMLLGGARFDARWSLEAGLVDELTTPATLLPRAIELAEEFALAAPAASAATRRLVNAPLRAALDAALLAESAECVALHRAGGAQRVRTFLTHLRAGKQ